MSLLDRLGKVHRDRMLKSCARRQLNAGEYLLHRGEPGGDVYLLESGTLEVVDSRQRPEVILSVLPVGAVVGEMAYLDYRPRSADVRAGTRCQVAVWTREELDVLIEEDAKFGTAFFRAIAHAASLLIRNLTEGAVARNRASADQALAGDAKERARALADPLKNEFPLIETRLRQDPADAKAARQLIELLDELQEGIEKLFVTFRDQDVAYAAKEMLHRELHAFLVRSSLAERFIRRAQGVGRSAQILSHLLVDSACGDGRAGELVDRWLLDRPTFAVSRAQRRPLLDSVLARLPTRGERRVLFVNAGTGGLIARLVKKLGSDQPATITVIDQSRDALAFVTGMIEIPKNIVIHAEQDNLPKLAMGRGTQRPPPQHVIVLHGLLEYFPDRMVVSLLRTCNEWMMANGVVITTSLTESEDAAFLDRILEWPTIRRSYEQVVSLFRAAGLEPSPPNRSLSKPGLIVCGSRNEETVIRSGPLLTLDDYLETADF